MKRVVYPERRYPTIYDAGRCMVYLNEESADYYAEPDATPIPGYAYTGTETDGGTLISSPDLCRDNLINGLIRIRYSQSAEDAIKTHQINALMESKTVANANDEWAGFEAYRTACKVIVDGWLAE